MDQVSSKVDRALLWGLRGTALLTASIVLLILAFLLIESRQALQAIGPLRFLTDGNWMPLEGSIEGQFGLLPMAWASLATTLGAVLLAGPLGVLSALFTCYYAPPKVGFVYARIVEILAGMPSVVYGFWGLVTLVPLLRRIAPPGPSLMAGILILTIMILPTVALLSESTLRTVPRAHMEGAAALGLSRWKTLSGVVLPSTYKGLAVALLLGTMRAIGETMAVLMVTGNVIEISPDLFRPVRTLTANIALELGYATEAHRSVLFVSGLLLMILVLGLVVAQDRLKKAAPGG